MFVHIADTGERTDSLLIYDVLFDLETNRNLQNYHTVIEQKSFSGNRSCAFSNKAEYGVTFYQELTSLVGSKKPESAEFGFYIYTPDSLSEVFAVMAVEDKNGTSLDWQSVRIHPSLNKWEKIKVTFGFKQHEALAGSGIKFYVWNKSLQNFKMDDISIKLRSKVNVKSPSFVTLGPGGFQLNNKPFYPVALNYIVSLQTDGDLLWASPYKGYSDSWKFIYTQKDSNLNELAAHMELIKEMGFNSIRIVGIGEIFAPNIPNGEIAVKVFKANSGEFLLNLKQGKNYETYFAALSELFRIIEKSGLKIIFLTKVKNENTETEEHLEKLVSRFKDESSVFAYDLFNEPLYFDSLDRYKGDVASFTRRWHNIIKSNAPQHLSTIGLAGVREVMEWDPNMLDVDFISIHPYEYEPEQVRNEMYWYHKYIKKPWIIGETAIPADDDSISYEDQREFAGKTLQQAYNCGAIGYSWWQYMDVEWVEFHPSYMGVVSRRDSTRTKSGFKIRGTVKPVATEFLNYKKPARRDSCICLDNYYNYSESKVFQISGKVMDENDNPIEGAVILGWNSDWSRSYHTISRKDGSFVLLGSFPFYNYRVSATLHTSKYGTVDPLRADKPVNGIPEVKAGKIIIEKI